MHLLNTQSVANKRHETKIYTENEQVSYTQAKKHWIINELATMTNKEDTKSCPDFIWFSQSGTFHLHDLI